MENTPPTPPRHEDGGWVEPSTETRAQDRAAALRMRRQALLVGAAGFQMSAATALGYLLGRWLDARLGTRPWLAILLAMLGALAGFIELFRLTRRAQAARGADAAHTPDDSEEAR